MKNSYTVYAAVSQDGSSIFQRNSSRDDDSGELLEWFDEWEFNFAAVPDCGYIWGEVLAADLKREKVAARIKLFKLDQPKAINECYIVEDYKDGANIANYLKTNQLDNPTIKD